MINAPEKKMKKEKVRKYYERDGVEFGLTDWADTMSLKCERPKGKERASPEATWGRAARWNGRDVHRAEVGVCEDNQWGW